MGTKKRGVIVVLGSDLVIERQLIKSGRYPGYVQWEDVGETGEPKTMPLQYFIQVDAHAMREAGNDVPDGMLSMDAAVTKYVNVGAAWLEV